MKIKKQTFLLLFLIFLPVFSIAQENPEPEWLKEFGTSSPVYSLEIGGNNLSAGADCFDYYKFDSVKINISPEKDKYFSGEEAIFSGFLNNTNDYPIVRGYLYVQIYRKQDQQENILKNGDLLVDAFFSDYDFAINANSKKPIDFSWKIPKGLKTGKYYVASYLSIDKKFNLSGVSFMEQVIGGISHFEIENKDGVKELIFDKNKVEINGKDFNFRNFVPSFSGDENIKISYVLKSLSNSKEIAKISTRLYYWDNIHLANLVIGRESIHDLELQKGETKNFLDNLGKLDKGRVYLYEISVFNDNFKTILKIRFVVDGETSLARLNYSAVNSYPLKQGEGNYFFTCFHNTTDKGIFDGKVITQLKDKSGNVLSSHEYSGQISPAIMAFKNDFALDKEYYEFVLNSQITDLSGNLIDEVNLVYDCSQFQGIKNIDISLNGNEFLVKPFDACNNNISGKMYIEIQDESGNAIFQENGFIGNEFRKQFDFIDGKKYKITALMDGFEKSQDFVFKKDIVKDGLSKYFYYILGFLVLFVVILSFIKNKKDQEIKYE